MPLTAANDRDREKNSLAHAYIPYCIVLFVVGKITVQLSIPVDHLFKLLIVFLYLCSARTGWDLVLLPQHEMRS